MPTKTFYNLKPEKREKVEAAIKKEFARVPLESMSVRNIVKESGIARGSFYQYFSSREDLILHMLTMEFGKEEDYFKDLLIECNKDLFEASYKYLIRMLDNQEKAPEYYLNMFKYLDETRLEPLERIKLAEIEKYVDFLDINVDGMDEIKAAIRVISTLTFTKKINILKGSVSKEDGLIEYKEELDILKKGLEKK